MPNTTKQPVDVLAVPRSFSLPAPDLEKLQVQANRQFNGNVSLAVRWALQVTYGIGDPNASRPLRPG